MISGKNMIIQDLEASISILLTEDMSTGKKELVEWILVPERIKQNQRFIVGSIL